MSMKDEADLKKEKGKEFLKKLISIFYSASKNIKKRGESPSKFSILEEIVDMPEISAILAETIVSDILPNEYYIPENKEIETLTQKVIDITNALNESDKGKIDCFSKIATLEKRIGLEGTYYKGIISNLSRVLAEKMPKSVGDRLKSLSDVAINRKPGLKESFAEFETAYSTLTIPVSDPECEKTADKEASCSITDHIENYRDIIFHLKENLDSDQLVRIEKIEERIQSISTLDDYYAINNDILALIKSYTKQVNGSLGEAAQFIFEISAQLVDVEQTIKGSAESHIRNIKANVDFNSEIEKHMAELSDHVNFSKTLSEMKTAVVSSLSNIKMSLDKKRRNDKDEKEEAEKLIRKLREQLSLTINQVLDLENRVLKDGLTGCYSFFAYENRLNDEIYKFNRNGRPFCVLLFDVDHFKDINDNYGHLTGDKCLQEIIGRVRMALRKTDLLARYSGAGDEFLILLPETDLSMGVEIAEKVRTSVEGINFIHKSKTIKITVSIGLTEIHIDDQSHETIFTRIDAAMYKSKKSGGNTIFATE